ncbi:hypothetical protein DS2_02373 [Catenovulum agarivorans DS-2]|uniref:Uncharacterized protein n=2 Tax=Catenovulum agarivorans TaxID=1172192 RepID=W7QSI6_9ALTE|nr:hypothetical protein DS2_02373 [Catenovulum agarivorans DS-2]
MVSEDKNKGQRHAKMSPLAWLIVISVALLPLLVAFVLPLIGVANGSVTVLTIITVLIAVLVIQLIWAHKNNQKK